MHSIRPEVVRLLKAVEHTDLQAPIALAVGTGLRRGRVTRTALGRY